MHDSKIDWDNDGGISWDEFSSYILALGQVPVMCDVDVWWRCVI